MCERCVLWFVWTGGSEPSDAKEEGVLGAGEGVGRVSGWQDRVVERVVESSLQDRVLDQGR